VTKLQRNAWGLCAAIGIALIAPGMATAQKTTAPLTITRAKLAKNASFTVTSVLAPNGGSKVSQVFRVEIKGNKARMDYSDPLTGEVRYLANEKGVYFVVPASKAAMKQNLNGGVEQALQVAFAQVNAQLKTAVKTGESKIDGFPVDVYKEPKTGALIYVGKKPGFQLPIKAVTKNEGGSRTITVTNIKLNPTISDARFALPAGVRITDGGGAAPGVGIR
jgi:outer membrane lipoprotein-sorting protein